MTNYLDYKAIVWFRIPIQSKDAMLTILDKLVAGTLPLDLYDDMNTENEIGECEVLYDSEEFISPNENDGEATIEVYSGDDEYNLDCIWDNSYQSTIKRHEAKLEEQYYDLFLFKDKKSEELNELVDKYTKLLMEGDEDLYEICDEFLKAVNEIGYTFDYGLDGEPYGLRPIGVDIDNLII